MNTSTIIEIVGYVGSALVLISFLMSSVVKLRIVNLIGSLIFAVYALIIKSYPTAVMNLCLVGINLYFLWKLRHSDPSYRMLKLDPGETYVQDFLDRRAEDISACFPGRSLDKMRPDRVYMVFHGDEPAGILMGHEDEGALSVDLDYSIPAYRDCSVGKYMFDNMERPLLIRYGDAEESHIAYLKRMGFTENGGVWEKQL